MIFTSQRCITPAAHSRPQSPSFLGHVVGKRRLSRVALETRMPVATLGKQVMSRICAERYSALSAETLTQLRSKVLSACRKEG